MISPNMRPGRGATHLSDDGFDGVVECNNSTSVAPILNHVASDRVL